MAQKTGAMRHTHKYYRAEDRLWYCSHTRCSHYMPLNVAHQMEGRASICWECGNEFTLSGATMDIPKPVCIGCKLGGVDENELAKYLEKKGL